MEDDMTTICVREKDAAWLFRVKHQLKFKGMGVVVEKMIKLIKLHKMEEELK